MEFTDLFFKVKEIMFKNSKFPFMNPNYTTFLTYKTNEIKFICPKRKLARMALNIGQGRFQERILLAMRKLYL